ncbi:hypothetical protein G9F73_019670 [Clostridium estertheticum]|uniref:hypothetical protein n=1 Tax=Clostridium estertheticum TaxID=238834 RepID=UPI0013EEB623|nr:hypothetical protein [Clostridium estertheticum]MBZ9609946.1 hypothetical protein [Clostridium estertheticum]
MEKERGCVFTGILMLVLFGAITSLIVNLFIIKSNISSISALIVINILSAIIQMVSVFCIIANRKIGIYLYIFTALINFILNIFIKFNIVGIMGCFVMTALILIFTTPYYKEMK